MDGDPLWYKDAIVYQAHVRAYKDSNADGIGDFRGLTSKLDYLQDLGVTAIWLLPFYPSPLRDDGYDIADYTAVNGSYGSLRDVKQFIGEAHRRGLRVITEMVCNHTSDQHPWFQRARRAKAGTAARDFYVWSDSPERYKDARIIFTDYERSNWTWDPVANAYFWHRFYHHQPDLNFDNPAVARALMKALDYWLEMGVDGVRLDAIPYLYEREGTNCENLPETHQFLKALRKHVDERFGDRMFLSEANQWPEDVVQYFGDGDECHMNFHFPLMPRMYMALRTEDRFPIVDILNHPPPIPDSCQWALFLRNHDELTLEMVTDEERDYMYRVYAQDPAMRINVGIRRRLAPLLGNNRRRIELMNGLLFSLPGTPILYYGDEIGMGDNVYLGDRNGVRTPMQWSADRNAGFSDANPQRLYFPVIIDPEYHYQTVNVEAQQGNPHSLLWWTKRLIGLRKRYRAFGRGTVEFLHPENRKVLAYVRRYGDEQILVVANLSRFVQYVELDVSAFRGSTPVEAFGLTPFPRFGDGPFVLTLGPHAFYWFEIQSARVESRPLPSTITRGQPFEPPRLEVSGSWLDTLEGRERGRLAAVLARYLPARRWFAAKARRIRQVQIVDTIPLGERDEDAQITFVQIDYADGDPDTYVIPLAFATGEAALTIARETPHAVVAHLAPRRAADEEKRASRPNDGILYDATVDRSTAVALLEAVAGRRRLRGAGGEIVATPAPAFRHMRRATDVALEPALSRAEQSNTSIVFGGRYIMKLYRRLEAGVHPDVEISRYLTDRGFAYTPSVAAVLEYRRGRGAPITLALLQTFVQNEGDAWQFTLDALARFYDSCLAESGPPPDLPLTAADLLTPLPPDEAAQAVQRVGTYLPAANQIGRRTADLHVALASPAGQADFAPEPFTELYQRSLNQSMRSQVTQVFQLLRRHLDSLSEAARADAEQVVSLESRALERLRALARGKIEALRTRTHGDYHLGQVLYTGDDFAIIDFEGEPLRPLGERRLKRSPIRDVAGMLRSFHYAAYSALSEAERRGVERAAGTHGDAWARYWYRAVATSFLTGYLEVARPAGFLPADPVQLELLLDVFLIEKAVYELAYELNNRPDWVRIPLQGIVDLLAP